MMTLDRVPSGSRVKLRSLEACPHGLARRLMEMGLVPGEEIEVVSNIRGPVIIRVRGVVLALGRGIARRILVE